MSSQIFNQYNNLRFLYLFCILTYMHSSSGIKDMKQTTSDISYRIKYLEEQAEQERQKIKICNQANITNQVFVPEEGVIKILFNLTDEKFQNCFKYFNIILEKKRKKVKIAKIPYLHDEQKMISHKFENVSCGVYEVFVQPCYNDRICLYFRWTYKKSINVTSKSCTEKLQNGQDKNNRKIIVISSLLVFIFLLTGCGFASYCYFPGKQKFKKIGYKINVADHEYIGITASDDNKTKRRHFRICIFFFQDYDDKETMIKIKKEVEAFKYIFVLLLNYLCDIAAKKGQESSLFSSIKLIECKLSKIIPHIHDFLNDAVYERAEDNSLQKFILIDPKLKMEDEDSIENIIFSDLKTIFNSQCLTIQLPISSKDLDRECHYYIPVHLVDLFLNLYSGSELVTPKTERRLKRLLPQHLIEHLDLVQVYELLQDIIYEKSRAIWWNSRCIVSLAEYN